MSLTRMYGLFLRHFYLITRSFPRVLDLVIGQLFKLLYGDLSQIFLLHIQHIIIMQ